MLRYVRLGSPGFSRTRLLDRRARDRMTGQPELLALGRNLLFIYRLFRIVHSLHPISGRIKSRLASLFIDPQRILLRAFAPTRVSALRLVTGSGTDHWHPFTACCRPAALFRPAPLYMAALKGSRVRAYTNGLEKSRKKSWRKFERSVRALTGPGKTHCWDPAWPCRKPHPRAYASSRRMQRPPSVLVVVRIVAIVRVLVLIGADDIGDRVELVLQVRVFVFEFFHAC